MTTPQNLPALIKEMQERVPFRIMGTTTQVTQQDLDQIITDTANATLEYVKGVAGELRKDPKEGTWFCDDEADRQNYNQALEDLVARLTSNPE